MAAASIFSLFVGWFVALVSLRVLQVRSGGALPIEDSDFWLLPAIFAFLGWALFVLPIIAFAPTSGRLYQPFYAAMAGTGLALVAYAVLVCSWAPSRLCFAGFPAIVGGVAGVLCSLLARSRCRTYVLFCGPSLVFLFLWCILWPSLENLTPGFTYTYGSTDAQVRSIHRILQSVKVGDSILNLHRQYPALFPSGARGVEGGSSTLRYEFRYEIGVDRPTGLVNHVSSQLSERRP